MEPAGIEGDLLAGRDALARGAWAEAREAFERVLTVETSAAEALEGAGWACYWLDDVERSIELREQACRAFRDADARRDAARVATVLAVDTCDIHGEAVGTGWLELARRQLEGLPPGPEHGWLLLWEGQFARMFHDDTEEARRCAAEASELGRRLGQPDLELVGNAVEGLALVSEGEIAAGMRKLDGLVAGALVGELGDLASVAQTCCFLLHACEWVKDYNRMAQWGTRIDAFANHWNIGSMFNLCRTQHGAMLIGRGEWSEADALLDQLNTELLRTRPWFSGEALEQLGELRRRQGRWEEARELFRRAGARALPLIGRAQIALDEGAVEEARELAEQALRRLSSARWLDRAVGLSLCVRARLGAGDVEGATQCLAKLASAVEVVGTPYGAGIARHADGVFAAHAGDQQAAREAYGDAIASFEDARAPYETARVRLDMARALARLDEGALALREADAAAEGFRSLGAERDVERAAAVRASLADAEPGKAASEKNKLTAREREVLRLVADGLGDRSIAEALGISEHTVHRHVSNILTKLDRPSRAAAVACALREDLL